MSHSYDSIPLLPSIYPTISSPPDLPIRGISPTLARSLINQEILQNCKRPSSSLGLPSLTTGSLAYLRALKADERRRTFQTPLSISSSEASTSSSSTTSHSNSQSLPRGSRISAPRPFSQNNFGDTFNVSPALGSTSPLILDINNTNNQTSHSTSRFSSSISSSPLSPISTVHTSADNNYRTRRNRSRSYSQRSSQQYRRSSFPSPLLSPTSFPETPIFADCQTDAMSFLLPSHNLLSHDLKIWYDNQGIVDMFGATSTGSSYSLPGSILITLPAMQDRPDYRREVKSLELIVEGMADYYDHEGRYTPLRTFTQTIFLASAENPISLPSRQKGPLQDGKLLISVPFDLRIPGWLPSSIDSRHSRVSYGAIVKSSLGWTARNEPPAYRPKFSFEDTHPNDRLQITECDDDEASIDIGSSRFSTRSKGSKSRPSTSRMKMAFSISKYHNSISLKPVNNQCHYTPFKVFRHKLPSALGFNNSIPIADRTFTMHLDRDSDKIAPIDCMVMVPEWVDVNGPERGLKISMRLKARKDVFIDLLRKSEQYKGIDEDLLHGSGVISQAGHDKVSPWTNLIELGVEVEETEKYISQAPAYWHRVFPIPQCQPNRRNDVNALISPTSPFANMDAVLSPDASKYGRPEHKRSCLLADDWTQRTFAFSGEGLGLVDKWRKVNVFVPMPRDTAWNKKNRPLPDYDGPFLKIRHQLKIKMTFKNPETGTIDEMLLSTPLRFATSPATMPNRLTFKEKFQPPAYIQVFHENGDIRQCDPLPMYTKLPPPTAEDLSITLPVETSTIPVDDSSFPGYNSGFESSFSSSSSDDSSAGDNSSSYSDSLPQSRSSSPEFNEEPALGSGPLDDVEGLTMIQRQEINEREELDNIQEAERVLDPIRHGSLAIVRNNLPSSSSLSNASSTVSSASRIIDEVLSRGRTIERWQDLRRRFTNSTAGSISSSVSENGEVDFREAARRTLLRNREMMRIAAETNRERRELLEREGQKKVKAVLQSW